MVVVGTSTRGKPAACVFDLQTSHLIFVEYSEEASATSLVSVAVDNAGLYAYVGTGNGNRDREESGKKIQQTYLFFFISLGLLERILFSHVWKLLASNLTVVTSTAASVHGMHAQPVSQVIIMEREGIRWEEEREDEEHR